MTNVTSNLSCLRSGFLYHHGEESFTLGKEADLTDGVLTLRIPVAETARPRRIAVSGGSGGSGAIEATATEDAPAAGAA